MKIEIVTTITSSIDADTLEVNHAADIVGEAGLPESVVKAVALAGCRATVKTLEEN